MEGGRGMYKDCIVTVDVYFQAVMVFRFTTVPTVSIMDDKYIIFFNEVPWYRCEWDMSISVNYVHSVLNNSSLKLL